MRVMMDFLKSKHIGILGIVLVIVAFLVVSSQAAEIHGLVWNDLNRDGIRGDVISEPGISGEEICYGQSPINSTLIQVIDCTSSTADGTYAFVNAQIGEWYVYDNLLAGYDQSVPGPDGGYQYHVLIENEGTVINGFDFGDYQLVPPSGDVTLLPQSGTGPITPGDLNGIPTIMRPTLTTLTIQKDLSAYNVVGVVLEMYWFDSDLSSIVDMSQIGTTGVWAANVPPPAPYGIYPSGDARMTFSVDVYPPGPDPNDIIQVGDVIFLDPSGQVLDFCTNQPINGAVATLYLYDPETKSSIPCPLENIRIPATNTLVTGPDGKYYWMTTGGSYYVKAGKAGYTTMDSSIVSVPPPASDLDIWLTPTDGCPPNGEPSVYPLTISLQQVQIFPHGAEKVQIKGEFALDAMSDGIDPVGNGVDVRLFLPGGLPGSGQFYPPVSTTMPVRLQPMTGGWVITPSEKSRTGIQDLKILKTSDSKTYSFLLVDTRNGIMDQDYQKIGIEISSGNDSGIFDVSLTKRNGIYTL